MRRTVRRCLQRVAFYDQTVEEYASQEMHHLTVGNVLQQAAAPRRDRTISSAQYVHQQLPIRLATSIRRLQTLPFIVGVNPYVNDVYHMYWDAFQAVRKVPPIATRSQADDFTELLVYLLTKNRDQVQVIAKGISEVRSKRIKRLDSGQMDAFLDQILTEALARRTIVALHLAYADPPTPAEGDWAAIFRRDCAPAAAVAAAMAAVRRLSLHQFQWAPECHVTGDVDARFMYIPTHLDFILFEMLKNAAYATCRRRAREPDRNLRPIEVTIRQGDHLEIVIADEGGGLRMDKKERIWSYGFTGEEGPVQEDFVVADPPHVAGLPPIGRLKGSGFGLPTARVYLRYLGGGIAIHSTRGYGCHCHLAFPPILDSFLLT